jgi:hypothetical protein
MPALRTNAPPRCIAVDWSGARHGERRKLWLAEARDGRVVRLESGRSRVEVVEHIVELARSDPELLVGLDFAFAFPEWFVRELGCADARALWRAAEREGERWLAECAPPFWGRPGRRRPEARADRPPYRATESVELPARGIGPKSVFQIGGAGAVGTGSIRGMPYLLRLAEAGFSIWPFDATRPPVAVEIYPRQLTGPVNKSSAAARELWLATHASEQDRELVRRARSSEDAFDAFASALALARQPIRSLEPARDARERLEGRILRVGGAGERLEPRGFEPERVEGRSVPKSGRSRTAAPWSGVLQDT